MNIFITSKCPVECAKFLDDKRTVKMCLETTQMLCTALNLNDLPSPYKTAHKNHPCSIWARETRANWNWLWSHGMALCNEYTKRYKKEHKCEQILKDIFKYGQRLSAGGLTPFPNCTRNKENNIDHRDNKDVFIAYQLYLNDRWDTDKKTPTWYGETK